VVLLLNAVAKGGNESQLAAPLGAEPNPHP
jgi:hypothetical protein